MKLIHFKKMLSIDNNPLLEPDLACHPDCISQCTIPYLEVSLGSQLIVSRAEGVYTLQAMSMHGDHCI